jgi:formylglycine-generating enzyme required for sulfatase activity
MDNAVHNSLPSEEKEKLAHLQEELEDQELIPLLEQLKQRCNLSVNQIAVAAGMDESALHKILKGENREFKANHVDALLDDLEQQNRLSNSERVIWQRALRVAAWIHYHIYKMEPRVLQSLLQIEDIVKRVDAWKVYVRKQFQAAVETYDESDGMLPMLVPLIPSIVSELNKRYGWIRIPLGYELSRIESNRYYLINYDLFPKKIASLGPDLEIEDTGFGTYTIRRHIIQSQVTQLAINQREYSGSNIKQLGGIEFVRIPAGIFVMGSRGDNPLALNTEKPQHVVAILYDYWIGQFPVTNEQFAKFVEAKKHKHEWIKDWKEKTDHPVVNVYWDDAQAYCRWLNETHDSELPKGYAFRLPTEAEWEKAARGEFGFEWPWGNEFDKNKCNSYEGSKGDTTPVGLYSPTGDSPYGCADMVGNVWEWTQSLDKGYPYDAKDGREDFNAAGGRVNPGDRVLRGGSFYYLYRGARCAFRLGGMILVECVISNLT